MGCSRGGNSCTLHQRLCKALGRLDLGCRTSWPEDWPVRSAKCIDYPDCERSFWTNECQVDISTLGESEQAFDIVLLDRYAVGELRDSCVSLRADQLDRRVILLEFPRNRVFASAVADEYLSGSRLR